MKLKNKIHIFLSAAVLLFNYSFVAAETKNLFNGSRQSLPEKTSITFADVGWDSIRFHNAIAGLIAEKVFGYSWSEVPGSTPITFEAIKKGEIDIEMEAWSDNIPSYNEDVQAGRLNEVGVNFDDNKQGFYIPQYVADENPGLKSVEDLKDYAHLFPDLEEPGKARIFGGIPGWEITEIMRKKIGYYELENQYNYVIPGSDAAMNATLISALDRKEAIVAYYWEPTWLLGMYDFVLLEDRPFDENIYFEGGCECPSVKVNIVTSNEFAESNPAYVSFLKRYQTSSAMTSEGLAYMQENEELSYVDAALWFLKEAHPELIDQWLTPEQSQKLKEAL